MVSMAKGKRSYPFRVTSWTAVITLVVMTVYEAIKEASFPPLAPWTSHAITIVFTTGLASIIGWIVAYRARTSHRALVAAKATLDEELNLRKRFRRMSELLAAARSRDEIAAVMKSYLMKAFPETSGVVSLFSPSRDVVEPLVSWGDHDVDAREFAIDECWSLRLGKPYGLNEGGELVPCRHWASEDRSSHLCVPMLADGETLGILCVRLSDGSEASRSTTATEAIIGMAERLALPVANLRLRETLRNQSIKDGLTGVFNRRYMEESLARELTRAARRSDQVSVVMIDLDHFKRINDTCGHDAGDEMLRAFGKFLSARVRNEDIVCRYGGEEFALILPETTPEAALQVTDRLRQQFPEVRIDDRGGGFATATFSAGVASFPANGRSAAELLRAADRALYNAKSSGRNQVQASTQPGVERVA